MADGPDGLPVFAISAYQGKRVADMSRDELIAALNGVWRAYVAINADRLTYSGQLGAMPKHDVAALEATLHEWFYGPHAT